MKNVRSRVEAKDNVCRLFKTEMTIYLHMILVDINCVKKKIMFFLSTKKIPY
jgi:hypothetical protein